MESGSNILFGWTFCSDVLRRCSEETGQEMTKKFLTSQLIVRGDAHLAGVIAVEMQRSLT